MVVIGLEVELGPIAEAAAVIVVAPQIVLADPGARRDPVVEVALLQVVNGAAIVLACARDDEREGIGVRYPSGARGRLAAPVINSQTVIVKAEPGAHGDVGLERAGVIVERLITPAKRTLEEWPGDVDRGARGQLDRTAEPLGLVVGQQGIGDDDAIDRAGRNGVELHRAAASARGGAPRVCVQQRDAAIGRSIEIGVDAADLHEAPFTGVAGQRDARQAAERLGGVEVWILLDGLGGLHGNQIGGLELHQPRLLFLARRGDDHFTHGRGRRRRFGGKGGSAERGKGDAGKQRQGERSRRHRCLRPEIGPELQRRARLIGSGMP